MFQYVIVLVEVSQAVKALPRFALQNSLPIHKNVKEVERLNIFEFGGRKNGKNAMNLRR